jgi:Serpin (serine protease inhibitor)
LGIEVLYDGDAPNLPNAKRSKSNNAIVNYQIAGTNPDGSTYTGEAEIKPWDAAIDVHRTIGNDEATGTAISFDGAFALALPRFKVESDVNLIPPLQQAGMKLAFDGDRADFSGMTGKPASGGGGLGAFLGHLDHGAMLDLGDRLVIAPSIKDVFEKHNLIGTFAWNCSMLPSANDNWYFVNRVIDADHIQRDYMTGPTTRAWYAILDKAAEKSANEISVSGSRNGKPTDGIWRVEQNRMLQWEATFDGKKLIASGKWVATGKVMPWLNRCGD